MKKINPKWFWPILLCVIFVLVLAGIVLFNFLSGREAQKITQNTGTQTETLSQEQLSKYSEEIVMKKSVINFPEQGVDEKNIAVSELPAAVSALVPQDALNLSVLLVSDSKGNSWYKVEFDRENTTLAQAYNFFLDIAKVQKGSRILSGSKTNSFSMLEFSSNDYNFRVTLSALLTEKFHNVVYAQKK